MSERCFTEARAEIARLRGALKAIRVLAKKPSELHGVADDALRGSADGGQKTSLALQHSDECAVFAEARGPCDCDPAPTRDDGGQKTSEEHTPGSDLRGSRAPMWGTKAEALRMTRREAFENAKRWGPDWREVVRVVRVGRRRG